MAGAVAETGPHRPASLQARFVRHADDADAMQATLCIVVPVLDEAPNLASQLGALQPFRRRGARVVVVDGGSGDDSLAIAAEFADFALVSARGRARQMNAGAATCSAELLLFLHADTRLPHDADTLVRRALQAPHRWGRFDVAIDSPRPVMRLVETLMNLRSRWTGIATGDQAVFVRRDLFDQVGGFPDQPLMEDVALSTRLKRHGPPACLRERVTTSARRWERQGPWRTILLMWRLRAAYALGVDPAKLATRYGYRPPPP
jgi:rSAM/selenodomain-associated transferase 2